MPSGTKVSDVTLFPLGQSKKAIGHVSQIGPCVATHQVDNRQACWFQETNGAVTVAKMEPRGRSVSPLRTRKRSRTLGLRKTTLGSRSGRSNGWAECREKKIGIEPMGSTFFLTSPLIGLCYMDGFRLDGVFANHRMAIICGMRNLPAFARTRTRARSVTKERLEGSSM